MVIFTAITQVRDKTDKYVFLFLLRYIEDSHFSSGTHKLHPWGIISALLPSRNP
jgi:hypothetical protein